MSLSPYVHVALVKLALLLVGCDEEVVEGDSLFAYTCVRVVAYLPVKFDRLLNASPSLGVTVSQGPGNAWPTTMTASHYMLLLISSLDNVLLRPFMNRTTQTIAPTRTGVSRQISTEVAAAAYENGRIGGGGVFRLVTDDAGSR